ncbi:hypothetical protein A7D03_21805 [Aeromonas salmonicida]|nr:hypothetical protein A7D03_21805 [Aeromonas salmonicida]
MIIGVPKEIKNHEYRVGMTPAGVQELAARGHKVLVQQQGGEAIGLSDAEYQAAGAELVASAAEIFARAEMIVKVKREFNFEVRHSPMPPDGTLRIP